MQPIVNNWITNSLFSLLRSDFPQPWFRKNSPWGEIFTYAYFTSWNIFGGARSVVKYLSLALRFKKIFKHSTIRTRACFGEADVPFEKLPRKFAGGIQ